MTAGARWTQELEAAHGDWTDERGCRQGRRAPDTAVRALVTIMRNLSDMLRRHCEPQASVESRTPRVQAFRSRTKGLTGRLATVLRIQLGVEDLGRIRFAAGPAPILEMVLMLFELRQRPQSDRDDARDWRVQVRSAFPPTARPLLNLVPSTKRAFYLDVLTQDAEEAFGLLHTASQSVHEKNLTRITNMNVAPTPTWLTRYTEGDPQILHGFDRALRTFHAKFLAPRWSSVTARFHNDIGERLTILNHHGINALLNTLSPHLSFNGCTLEGSYPWNRHVHLDGHGLILMPSAFWTGYPLFTWDPLDQSHHVLIYPAHPGPDRDTGHSASSRAGRRAGDALAALLGPTRAAVLRALYQPQTTSAIAHQVRISVSSASEHAATLRAAGLITTDRHGRAVVHHLSELGFALLSQEYL